jgi:hypothetical protein
MNPPPKTASAVAAPAVFEKQTYWFVSVLYH